MNLAAAPDKADALSPGSVKAAARLYNDVEMELTLGSYSEEDSEAGERALRVLESRFPGVRDAARDVTDPPALSHSARRRMHSEPEHQAPEPEPESAPEPERRRAGGAGGGSAAWRGTRRAGGRVGRRAFGFGGEDVAGSVITGLQWLLVAGLAYQAVQPRGAAAVSKVLGGIGAGVRLIVDPVDPLVGANPLTGQGYGSLPNVRAGSRLGPGLTVPGPSVPWWQNPSINPSAPPPPRPPAPPPGILGPNVPWWQNPSIMRGPLSPLPVHPTQLVPGG